MRFEFASCRDCGVSRRYLSSQHRIHPEEQVAQRPAAQVGQASPPDVLRPVVLQVAALAPGGEIAVAVAAGVVLVVACGQDRPGQPGA